MLNNNKKSSNWSLGTLKPYKMALTNFPKIGKDLKIKLFGVPDLVEFSLGLVADF